MINIIILFLFNQIYEYDSYCFSSDKYIFFWKKEVATLIQYFFWKNV